MATKTKAKKKTASVGVGQKLGGRLVYDNGSAPAYATTTRITDTKTVKVRYFSSYAMWVDITPRLISIEWEESEQLVSRVFTYTLDNRDGALRNCRSGGVVLVQVYTGGKWVEWHSGTVVNDGASRDISQAQWTLRVLDPLRFLAQTKAKFSFPGGRTASQTITNQLRKLRFPFGTIAPTTRKLSAYTYEGGLYGAAEALLAKDAEKTGNRYVQEWANGKYWLTRYTSPSWHWNADDALESIQVTRSIEESFTDLTLEGRVFGKSVKTAKAKSTASAKYTGAYGLVKVKEPVFDAYTSNSELKALAKKKVTDALTPTLDITVRFPQAAFTVRRLQRMSFVSDPVTGIGGDFYIVSLHGAISADDASLEVKLSRRPVWSELESGLEDPESSSTSVTGGSATGNKTQVARWLAGLAKDAGLPPELPVMAALQESNLDNSTVGDKGKAIGLFQIWPDHVPKNAKSDLRRDPNWQAKWFISTAKTVQAKYGYTVGATSRYGEWCANIELPAAQNRSKYQPHLAEARALIGGK